MALLLRCRLKPDGACDADVLRGGCQFRLPAGEQGDIIRPGGVPGEGELAGGDIFGLSDAAVETEDPYSPEYAEYITVWRAIDCPYSPEYVILHLDHELVSGRRTPLVVKIPPKFGFGVRVPEEAINDMKFAARWKRGRI